MNAADSRIKRFFPGRPTSGGFLARTRDVIARPVASGLEEVAIAIALLIGLALLVYGIASVFRPLGFISAGLLLIAISLGYLRGRSAPARS
jgi:hypothetical protein